MGCPSQEDYVFYRGEKFQVEFYFTQKGELPAKEYFELADKQIKSKLSALVKLIADTGRLFDENKFRLVDRQEKIYEFKPNEERFLTFSMKAEELS